jgi:hypothetical protein
MRGRLATLVGYTDWHDETTVDPAVILRNVGDRLPGWMRVEFRVRAWLYRRLVS